MSGTIKSIVLKFAVLIHIISWKYSRNNFAVDKGISFVRLQNHSIEKLYHKLCSEQNIDEGSPFTFNSALILHDETGEDHSFYPTASPQSISSIILNILSLINRRPLGFCRVIGSKDDFKTSWGTFELYNPLTENFYDFNDIRINLNSKNLRLFQKIWMNLRLAWSSGHSRIDNALVFYYLSWNTHTLEQTAISLSIVMETLFSPDSNTELSHQIAFNLAQFMGTTKTNKLEKYKMIKKYYTIRSKLVHGDSVRQEDINTIPHFFEFLSSVLLKIISNSKLIATFNKNESRKEYLRNKLFQG